MNICLISIEYPPYHHIGGIGTYNLILSRLLSEAGHSVDVITIGPEFEIRIEGNIRIHHLKMLPHILPKSRWMYYYRKWYRAFLPRLLNARTWSQTVSEYLLKFSKNKIIDVLEYPESMGEGAGIKKNISKLKVCRIHSAYVGNIYKNWLEKCLLISHMKKSCRIADVLVSPSRHTQREFGKKILGIKNKIKISPNPYLCKSIPKLSNAPNEKNIITFLGRIEYNKGLHILLSALFNINSNHNIFLAIYGSQHKPMNPDDSYIQNRLKAIIKNKKDPDFNNMPIPYQINYLGEIKNDQVTEKICYSNVLVVPSLSENFPYTVLEGLNSGNYIIASNCGGIPEMLIEPKLGALFKAGDANDLSEKILDYINKKALINSNRGFRIEHMEREFSFEKCLDRTLKTYMVK